MNSMIGLKNLSVSVSNKEIIKGVNYSFEKNKVYALMGPNGSGKSTLAYAIAGHPSYSYSKKSKIFFEKSEISKLLPDKRAKKGIFLSFQNPLSLNGVTVFQLLRLALSGIKEPLAVKKQIDVLADKLHIKKELISRSLNEGASGGEKKKLELLQAIVLDAKFIIFDEIDTGVDIDALKIIAEYMSKNRKNKTYLLITHYNRILKYVKPDKVLVMSSGKIVKVGDYKLAEEIEKNGYKSL
ncbi:MAG: FeS assembly ATPase SufC [Candidatus Roizmanbacteria bacterium GW2011_GWA2_35_19]|uniref:FeS assembly ATPase SufC n=1 Tax=Candidatus Roizmanbacteria bacterium GW2011_GWA2_35_19 TaxID=1618478 RepID=A0A0G0EGW3_9BACT|nr:MAG: FeS assembly ATPase SufC [Candidatus Roizmanbacteria bacterium GW2011_GWA2_35_19]